MFLRIISHTLFVHLFVRRLHVGFSVSRLLVLLSEMLGNFMNSDTEWNVCVGVLFEVKKKKTLANDEEMKYAKIFIAFQHLGVSLDLN